MPSSVSASLLYVRGCRRKTAVMDGIRVIEGGLGSKRDKDSNHVPEDGGMTSPSLFDLFEQEVNQAQEHDSGVQDVAETADAVSDKDELSSVPAEIELPASDRR